MTDRATGSRRRSGFSLLLGIGLAIAAGFASRPLPAAADEPSFEGPCLQAGCHAGLSAGKSVHPPVVEEMCDACHEEEAPHTFAPPPAADEICLTCHELEEGRSVHPPYEEAFCDGCHDPHRSRRRRLLLEPVPDLCLGCHDVPESAEDRRHRLCLNCHRPHASDHGSLQKEEPPDLCLRCHNRSISFEDRRIPGFRGLFGRAEAIHPPVEDDCTVCHDPHAFDRRALLAEAMPDGPYAAFDPDAYALCFQCHDAEMIDPGNRDTGFRNGVQNLHAVHVGGKKGRSCLLCHDPHAGKAHILRENTAFGRWRLPIGYEPGEAGGRCAPGCHEPRDYRRNEP